MAVDTVPRPTAGTVYSRFSMLTSNHKVRPNLAILTGNGMGGQKLKAAWATSYQAVKVTETCQLAAAAVSSPPPPSPPMCLLVAGWVDTRADYNKGCGYFDGDSGFKANEMCCKPKRTKWSKTSFMSAKSFR